MTIICWDGHTLAGDKRNNIGTGHLTTTKVKRIGDVLLGCAGSTGKIWEFQDWVARGRKPEDCPIFQRDEKEFVEALLIDAQGRCWGYAETPYPFLIENKFWAIGSGREFAMGAMFCGKTAREAVEVACALDTSCGNGIDTLTLGN
jgi:ATP-dependent protease HslVU (ClpYQ) peptidase subunit